MTLLYSFPLKKENGKRNKTSTKKEQPRNGDMGNGDLGLDLLETGDFYSMARLVVESSFGRGEVELDLHLT